MHLKPLSIAVVAAALARELQHQGPFRILRGQVDDQGRAPWQVGQ